MKIEIDRDTFRQMTPEQQVRFCIEKVNLDGTIRLFEEVKTSIQKGKRISNFVGTKEEMLCVLDTVIASLTYTGMKVYGEENKQ